MFAQQLYDLQKLYSKYKNNNFVVVAFPSNSFYNREPDVNSEIASNYLKKYGLEFPIMYKCEVKGDNICQVYSYLTNLVENGLNNNPVKWNFQKYQINEKGYLYKTIDPKINPLDNEIINWIEGY